MRGLLTARVWASVLGALVLSIAIAGTAWAALEGLPADGSQVNNDPAA
jgi:hypothetical protein